MDAPEDTEGERYVPEDKEEWKEEERRCPDDKEEREEEDEMEAPKEKKERG